MSLAIAITGIFALIIFILMIIRDYNQKQRNKKEWEEYYNKQRQQEEKFEKVRLASISWKK